MMDVITALRRLRKIMDGYDESSRSSAPRGFEAALSGRPISDCPFSNPRSAKKREAWEAGWRCAMEAADVPPSKA